MNDKLVLVGLLLLWMPMNIKTVKSLKEVIVARRRKVGAR